MPSTLTWCSSIASSSADWALGEARLSSSAMRMLVKTGPGRKTGSRAVGAEHGGTDHIGGQEVGGALEPVEAETQRPGQRLGQGRLAEAGVILDQEMPAAGQAGDRESDRAGCGGHHRGDRGLDGGERLAGVAGERVEADSCCSGMGARSTPVVVSL